MVDYIDVSPKQLVSVAAALIPFLENDDANRALMGSNMQRQAVPLLRPSAACRYRHGGVVARDLVLPIGAAPYGVVDQVDATRIVIRATEETDPTKPGVDIYRLSKFQRSNQNTCINQRPLVKVGDQVQKGDIIADGPRPICGELALGKNVLVAFMPWNGYNFEDSILISERIVRDDVFTSIHIEEFETMARDTKLGPEEITRDIPNVGEEALKNLDEAGIVYIGAEVNASDILVGKVTPKGETPMTPEEKLLRAIFGEKAADVRDTSLRVPPGVTGTVVEVRVFNRHGIDKDQRALAIERAEEERLAKDRDDELAILERNIYARLSELLLHKMASAGPKGMAADSKITQATLDKSDPQSMVAGRFENEKAQAEIKFCASNMTNPSASGQALRGQGGQAAPRRRTGAGRHEDGQGFRGGEAQAAARRQDGRPSRQQGRDLAHHADRGHAASGGWHPGRRRAQSAGCASPHECRPDSGDPSRLGVGRLGRQIGDMLDKVRRDGRIEPLRKTLKCVYASDERLGELDETGPSRTGRKSARRRARWQRRCSMAPRRKTSSTCSTQAGLQRDRVRSRCIDGRTGEAFKRAVTVGYIYMLKLHHLVDDKIHARSIGPYSLVTQQPLGGKAQFGGQRFGEMEVWALEAYGSAYTLQEILTVKSDDVAGRTKVYESIVRGEDNFEAGIPECFNVLVKEMRSLGLNVELLNGNGD